MKKKFINVLLILIAVLACYGAYKFGLADETGNNPLSSEKINRQDSLAFELAQIYGSDQGIRDMKLMTRSESGAIKFSPYLDSINFFKILDFVKINGMPCEELLGKRNFKREYVELAPIAVLLHTPHIIVNNDEYLMFFADLVKKGELKEGTFLTILDKYYWVKNQGRVLYGSQFGMPHLVDKEKTNKARSEIGIEPLADSLFIKH